MYYTNKITNHKLGSYTDDSNIASMLGFNIEIEEIEISQDGFAYERGYAPTPREKSYIELRLAEYPSIPDQLDMIYWDKVNGSNLWEETISRIKQKYPKK